MSEPDGAGAASTGNDDLLLIRDVDPSAARSGEARSAVRIGVPNVGRGTDDGARNGNDTRSKATREEKAVLVRGRDIVRQLAVRTGA